MNTKMKTNITRGCVGIFIVAAIFSFITLGKVTVITNAKPPQILTGNKLELENVYAPELSKEDASITIKSEAGLKMDYVFVRFTKNGETNHTYKIYTPSKKIYLEHELKQPHDGLGSLFQIISPAYANHNCPTYRIVCSGSYIDHQGNFHANGCWCK